MNQSKATKTTKKGGKKRPFTQSVEPGNEDTAAHEARRQSHNIAEKRRRDKINEKMKQLETMLPAEEDSYPCNNKAAILQKAVNYIRHLEQMYNTAYEQHLALVEENRQLRAFRYQCALQQQQQQQHQQHPHQIQQQQLQTQVVRSPGLEKELNSGMNNDVGIGAGGGVNGAHSGVPASQFVISTSPNSGINNTKGLEKIPASPSPTIGQYSSPPKEESNGESRGNHVYIPMANRSATPVTPTPPVTPGTPGMSPAWSPLSQQQINLVPQQRRISLGNFYPSHSQISLVNPGLPSSPNSMHQTPVGISFPNSFSNHTIPQTPTSIVTPQPIAFQNPLTQSPQPPMTSQLNLLSPQVTAPESPSLQQPSSPSQQSRNSSFSPLGLQVSTPQPTTPTNKFYNPGSPLNSVISSPRPRSDSTTEQDAKRSFYSSENDN
eukprot:TRINITY_DN6865_c0_g1_i1.p1 TRINITY_DN6865_c0_g1~~TRINITY_DN6865_c0_g1_i1.p1  ORF type:complete len:435 (-),score=91.28 TRINITY_DN6865_c0_g1_i1:90-1394(-)